MRFLSWSQLAILGVLLLLCTIFSILTLTDQQPRGESAAELLARRIGRDFSRKDPVLIVAGLGEEDQIFVQSLMDRLVRDGQNLVGVVQGTPQTVRARLEELKAKNQPLALIAGNASAGTWTLWEDLPRQYPHWPDLRFIEPASYRWPTFLQTSTLLNLLDNISIIAILAIGMTMVIIAGGIDLSVGSVVALSAVLTTWLIVRQEDPDTPALILACLGALLACGLLGLGTGTLITRFALPPFIVTLAVMLAARGLARLLSGEETIIGVPASFRWLGAERFLGIHVSILLMAGLYLLAHLIMTRTRLGRYIYAVGGNPSAAWLSGVPVRKVTILVYGISALLAGLGGILLASRFQAGDPKFGLLYELQVIAAVVVGGTSLSGGEGTIFGTFLGALLISVIQIGMNMINVPSPMQDIVYGSVIVVAVLADRLQRPAGSAP